MSRPDLGPLIQYFFTQHLSAHKQVSLRTIASYRDTFRLLLNHLHGKVGKPPSRLQVADLDAPAVLEFLDHLEQQRGNQPRSRNARLTAIRSFFRVVALRDPASLAVTTRVLAIPLKRTERRLVGYLTPQEMDAILAGPDTTTWLGRRDHALLLTMYNTGARASEIIHLRGEQLRLDATTTYIQLHGKGRKERTVPLWPKTGQTLKQWMAEQGKVKQPAPVLFPTVHGRAMSAEALDYLLQSAVRKAAERCASLQSKRVTPHMIRHSTAMGLLQGGVDIAVIALWLGHESIETTHGYLEADLKTKEAALDKIAAPSAGFKRYRPSDELLAFLADV